MCLNTLDHTLGETYSLLHGKNWRSRKFEEMKEPGLIYILLKEKSDSKDEILAGFLSMKFVDEDGLWVVYLYEIQIEEGYRNCGIGSQLLDIYSSIPDSLNENGSYTNRFGPVDGTALTVFSSNEGAFRFYKAHGYKLDRNSPRDRKLRDGKIRKPAYYIMIKYSAAGSIR
ncbi:DEKNAAC102377 [Brettanomyces naardenensis]|uniref:N-alpha-acetyltransferase 40 n=1 Tax=Brettanomyces naardenensis TaxID=13370 RepID=A0A448YKI4_BRENA|nr:DEKNAAC102377 [Brettanomyces naardenensis]